MRTLPDTHSAAALAAPFAKQPPPPSAKTRYGICSRILFAASLALITSTFSLGQSSNFTTLDSQVDATVEDLAIDANGVIYAAGTRLVDGAYKGIIRRSADHGVTWTDIIATDPRDEDFTAIAVSGTRVVVLACNVSVSDHATDPVRVLQSIDGGALTVIDDSVDPYKSQYGDIAIDSSGNVYLAGGAKIPITVTVKKRTTTELRNAWVVRRIGVDGFKKTISIPETAVPTFVGCASVVCVGSKVYLGGTSGSRWDVRRSDNEGTSWTVVDSFRYDESRWSYVTSLAAGPDNSIYALGAVGRVIRTGSTTTAEYSWYAKRSGVAGSTFAPLPGMETPWVNGTDPRAVVVDIFGGVHLTGGGTLTGGYLTEERWITRSFVPNQGWSTSENIEGKGVALAADSFGRIYSAGWTPTRQWVIRGPEPIAPVAP